MFKVSNVHYYTSIQSSLEAIRCYSLRYTVIWISLDSWWLLQGRERFQMSNTYYFHTPPWRKLLNTSAGLWHTESHGMFLIALNFLLDLVGRLCVLNLVIRWSLTGQWHLVRDAFEWIVLVLQLFVCNIWRISLLNLCLKSNNLYNLFEYSYLCSCQLNDFLW